MFKNRTRLEKNPLKTFIIRLLLICQIHFAQLFLLLKIYGEEFGGDVSSGYGTYTTDTEPEQGDMNMDIFQDMVRLPI